tara:strand:+ start:223 stop:381 length:159 start_codon:yes stop_codon:yes gene_type:complete
MNRPKGIKEDRIASLPLKNFPAKTRKMANKNPVRIAVSILRYIVRGKYNSYS